MASTPSKLMVIDGHGLIYRAYHAFPPLTTTDGILVNAVYGFTRILLTALRDIKPEYCVVTFDHKKPTLRAQSYAEYKAHREEMPDDLKPQIDIVKQVVQVLNIPQFEKEGYEADDLMGTISRQVCEESDVHVVIVTGDKDLLQLVTDCVHVWMPPRGKEGVELEYGPAEVLNLLKVTPAQVPDLKGLMGDTSDNIPGVKGIGPKTAQTLIQRFQSVEGVYEAVTAAQDGSAEPEVLSVLKGSILTKLIADKESALLSKKLATIDREAPVSFNLGPCKVSDFDKQAVIELFERLLFKSLIPLLPKDDFELGVQNALF